MHRTKTTKLLSRLATTKALTKNSDRLPSTLRRERRRSSSNNCYTPGIQDPPPQLSSPPSVAIPFCSSFDTPRSYPSTYLRRHGYHQFLYLEKRSESAVFFCGGTQLVDAGDLLRRCAAIAEGGGQTLLLGVFYFFMRPYHTAQRFGQAGKTIL